MRLLIDVFCVVYLFYLISLWLRMTRKKLEERETERLKRVLDGNRATFTTSRRQRREAKAMPDELAARRAVRLHSVKSA